MCNSGAHPKVIARMQADEPDDLAGRSLSLLLLFSGGDAHGRTCARAYRRGEFRLEPRIELARNYGLSMRQINAALRMIQEHEDEIRKAWKTHFPG